MHNLVQWEYPSERVSDLSWGGGGPGHRGIPTIIGGDAYGESMQKGAVCGVWTLRISVEVTAADRERCDQGGIIPWSYNYVNMARHRWRLTVTDNTSPGASISSSRISAGMLM